jgi:hypothetical protein|tara:strand:- start:2883 stop:3101 length:219 start_codon:yes stop_codon:yes gene_type:complete
MILRTYLNQENKTQTAFIHDVYLLTGYKFPQGTIAKYMLGQRIPRKKEMLLICRATNGKVQPNDFYLGENDE